MIPEERDAIIRLLDAATAYSTDVKLIMQAKDDMLKSDNPRASIVICADDRRMSISLTPSDIDCICDALVDRIDTIKTETKIKIMNMLN